MQIFYKNSYQGECRENDQEKLEKHFDLQPILEDKIMMHMLKKWIWISNFEWPIYITSSMRQIIDAHRGGGKGGEGGYETAPPQANFRLTG